MAVVGIWKLDKALNPDICTNSYSKARLFRYGFFVSGPLMGIISGKYMQATKLGAGLLLSQIDRN